MNDESNKRVLLKSYINVEDYDKVFEIIQSGIDLKATDDYFLPLMELTLNDNYDLDVMEFFVENGANVNEHNDQDFTPIMNVSYVCRYDIAKYLLSMGADVNSQTIYKTTPIFNCLGSSYFNLEFLKLLIEYGADPTQVDVDGETIYDSAKKNALINSNEELLKVIKDIAFNKYDKNTLLNKLNSFTDDNNHNSDLSLKEIIENEFKTLNYGFQKKIDSFNLQILNLTEEQIKHDYNIVSTEWYNYFTKLSGEAIYIKNAIDKEIGVSLDKFRYFVKLITKNDHCIPVLLEFMDLLIESNNYNEVRYLINYMDHFFNFKVLEKEKIIYENKKKDFYKLVV